MTIKKDHYSHSGVRCTHTRVYRDGCREVKVKDRNSGALRSHSKIRTPRHQNW
jgi:hypothetical protein